MQWDVTAVECGCHSVCHCIGMSLMWDIIGVVGCTVAGCH